MELRVALVNPPPASHAEMHDLPCYPHSAVAFLAAALRTEGFSVTVIDAKLERLPTERALERLRDLAPSLLGITCMTHDVGAAAKFAARARSDDPRLRVVVGGVHATALPADTLRDFPAFDFAVFGEGEETIVELARALCDGGRFDGIRGLAWKDGGEVRVNASRPWIENLDRLPMPAWDLFPAAREYHIVTARGCPFECVFCMSPYGNRVRRRSPESVVAEMRQVVDRYHPRYYQLNDESFALHPDRARAILDGIVAHPPLRAVPKGASLRVNNVTEDLMRRMKEAGFVFVDFGIESGDPEILKRIRKRITMDAVRRAVAITKAAGIATGGNYILGHPGETPETIRRTLRFAVELNCEFNAIGIMTPYPSTEIWNMARRGEWGYRLLSTDWRDYNKQLGNALEIEGLPRRRLEAYQLRGYVSIYLLNFRFLGFLRFCWSFRRSALAFVRNFLRHLLGGSESQTV
jgi:radical SAM superfamily enzyme YgiQ (UPF0313 family)